MIEIITIKVSFLFMKNYTYIIGNPVTKTAVLIDPAYEILKIENKLRDYHYELCGVLITHTHLDHVHLANYFTKKYNVPVFISAIELSNSQFNCCNIQEFSPDESLNTGNIQIQTLHTPGHSKGSTCYLIENNLFTGDTMFIEGCGICSCENDARDMFYSIQKIKSIVNSETRIYPGHCYDADAGQMISYLEKFNIYYNMENPDHLISFRMRKKQPLLFDFN